MSRNSAQSDNTAAVTAETYFLGPYRVIKQIGVGGMASVELARMDGEGGFRKWVAIKRIHPHLTEDRHLVRMFLEEARIAARISHPNVAQVFNVGKTEGIYWLAMEYLHGESLREVMVEAQRQWGTPIEPAIAATIIADAATGLHAAHTLKDRKGRPLHLVHRDVSPQNLFITYDGTVKVVDFGIAKVVGSSSGTQVGTFKGKIAYVPPEQARGMKVDRRADIFSLGVVLWEMTTGKRLFRMESDLETLRRVQQCIVIPPSAVVEDYPEELEQVVLTALQRSPEDRFQSALEMSRALRQFVVSQGNLIGSDEISAYMRSLFTSKKTNRDQELQLAEEVTRTVSLQEHFAPKPRSDEGFIDLLALEGPDDESGSFDSAPPESSSESAAPITSSGANRMGDPTTESSTSSSGSIDNVPEMLDDDEDDDEAATLIADSPVALEQQRLALRNLQLGAPRSVSSVPPTRVERPVAKQPPTATPPATPAVQAPLPPTQQAASTKVSLPPTPQAASVDARLRREPQATSAEAPLPPAPQAATAFQSSASRDRQANPLIALAAALAAGFIAAGIGAVWWAYQQSATRTHHARVTAAQPQSSQLSSSSATPSSRRSSPLPQEH